MSASTAKQPYTAAVIGCGKAPEPNEQMGKLQAGFRIGYAHATMYKSCPRVTLACAADINPANLRAFQDKFGVPGGFTDYQQMLREAKPRIVSIGTYVGLHRPMIEACVKAGVQGILCEKPFVLSPKDLADVKRLADESGCKIAICHQRRTLPVFDRARVLYNDGTIGQPLFCAAGIKDWDLSEWGSHWLDMFRYFHNDRPVQWVMGQLRVRSTRAFGHAMEDHGVAYFQFEGGGKGILDGGFGVSDPHMISLVGTDGVIHMHWDHVSLAVFNKDGRREENFKDHPGNDGFLNVLNGVIDWIEGGPVPVCGLPRTYGSAELNLAAYLSAARGDRVDLPLSDEDLTVNEWPVEIVARKMSGK